MDAELNDERVIARVAIGYYVLRLLWIALAARWFKCRLNGFATDEGFMQGRIYHIYQRPRNHKWHDNRCWQIWQQGA